MELNHKKLDQSTYPIVGEPRLSLNSYDALTKMGNYKRHQNGALQMILIHSNQLQIV